MNMILPLLLLMAGAENAARPQAGEAARPFSLSASSGQTVKLADYLGKKTVVLAFFPKAFTGGCTKEMSALRDSHPQFTSAEAQILGISMDSLETQKKFAESLKLPFPLLADTDGATAKAYGVANDAGYANRVTFVIGKDGKVAKVLEGREALESAPALGACHPAAP